MALHELSGGRMIVGVGAGWNEAEHAMFGYQLGDMASRMARFEEGLEVITRLMHSDDPVSFDGRFFQLRNAFVSANRTHGSPPIMIGGTGPRRTLPLVARYANRWDAGFLTLPAFQERSEQLNQLLHKQGRKPDEVKRSMTLLVICGHNDSELEERSKGARRLAWLANLPLPQFIEQVGAGIVGTPQQVAECIHSYAAAGVDEFIVQWTGMDDIEGLRLFAREVLPLVQG